MRDYRAYRLNIDGHRYQKIAEFPSDLPNDAVAMTAAEGLADRHDVELWDCARLVTRIDNKLDAVAALAIRILMGLNVVADQPLALAVGIENEEKTRRSTPTTGPLSRGGDRQDPANRLDPVRSTMIVNEGDHGLDRRSSSTIAK
jgi:hypothetical protein